MQNIENKNKRLLYIISNKRSCESELTSESIELFKYINFKLCRIHETILNLRIINYFILCLKKSKSIRSPFCQNMYKNLKLSMGLTN